jgi:DNA repair protein RadC
MDGLPSPLSNYFGQLAGQTKETVAFAFFDRDGEAVGWHRQSSDHPEVVTVLIRSVVNRALALEATQVVMAHNHPSGDPEPSPADLRLTRQLATVLDALEIRLVDHFVLSPGASVSFRARGLL